MESKKQNDLINQSSQKMKQSIVCHNELVKKQGDKYSNKEDVTSHKQSVKEYTKYNSQIKQLSYSNILTRFDKQKVIQDDKFKQIIKNLQNHNQIWKVDFQANKIKDYGFLYFVKESYKFKKLTNINFHSNYITDEGFKAFTEAAESFKNLKLINFGGNQIRKEGFKSFVEKAEVYTKLTTVYLGFNWIGNEGFKSFIQSFGNFKKLKAINLVNNNINKQLVDEFRLKHKLSFDLKC